VRQQFEGAAVMGTSLAFYGEITATNGVIDQSNFDSYQNGAHERSAARNERVHRGERRAARGNWQPGLPPFAPRCATRSSPQLENAFENCQLSKAGLA